ncbi:MAG: hypothetical protein WDN03_15425 [Rhizomicrobium sp.]
MTGWLRYLLIGGASAAAVAAVVYFGAPYLRHTLAPPPPAATTSSPSSDFTKAAYKVDSSGNLLLDSSGNPVPFTGPVHPGDEIEYVLTPPASGSSGSATITDTLSPNQTYVDPSIQAAGWTYPTPGYAGNTETYTRAASGGPTGFVLSIPAISGLSGTQNGGGDGFEPVPVLTSAGVKVFGINHHQPYFPSGQTPQIMCWFGASLANCSSAYPQNSSPGSDRRATPDFPHAVIYQKKIFFPAGRYDDVAYGTMEFGLGCWDAEADAACPFVPLPGAPSLNLGGSSSAGSYLGTNIDDYLAGLRADPLNPTHAYIYALGRIYCVDLAASGMPACSGWAAPAITPTGTSGVRGTDLFADEAGTRLFFSNSAAGAGTVRCFNFSDGSTCAGWPAVGVSGGATAATALGPGLDANGNMKAICFSQNFGTTPGFKCFDTLTSTAIAGPDPAWPAGFLTSAGIIAPYHLPSTKKVLFPGYSSGSRCYDFGTPAGCPGYTPYWSSGAVRDYGYAADPVSPENCIYGLGDGGILVRFKQDGTPATRECAPKSYTTRFSVSDQYCAQKPDKATWTTLDIANRPSELVGGTIVIKDSSGTVLQTITVTAANSYTVNLPATGASGTVTVEFTPNYGSNAPPTTDYQIRLDYTADINPQICYKTTIKDCGDTLSQGPVTNKAVYADADGTKEANVDLGKVVGGHCGPAPCLKLTETIVLNPDGTATVTITGAGPPGFNSVIVEVHSNTPGVSVAPPARTFPPGPFTGTWTLTGVTPGESVDLQVDAVDPGAGPDGGDKCCSSTVTVVVPPGHHDHQTDIGIQKTGVAEGQGPANGSGYIYTLSVTNYGVPVPGQNAIAVTDIVPAGLSFANASGTDWTCTGPFPIAAGGTLTCTYTGSATLATGQVLPPITVVSTNAVPGAPLPTITNCANVDFVPGHGVMDTNPTNNKSCVTNGTARAAAVMITKTPIIDGKATDAPGVAFQIAAICALPDGTSTNLGYTAGPTAPFSSPTHTVPLGTTCQVSEATPPIPAGRLRCHWDTTYLFNGATVASFPVTIAAAVSPANVIEVKNVLVCGGQVPPTCDPATAKADGGACVCLYPGMVHKRGEPTSCTCPVGSTLRPGQGCVAGPEICVDPAHWNGRACVTCPQDSEWNPRAKKCSRKLVCDEATTTLHGDACVCRYDGMTQAAPNRCTCPQGTTLEPRHGCILACRDPMVPDRRGTACVCPEGTTLRRGECVETQRDNPFDHGGGIFDRGRHGGRGDDRDDHGDNGDAHGGNGVAPDGGRTPKGRNGSNPLCVPGVPC